MLPRAIESTFGTEVQGVDLSERLDESVFRSIQELLFDRLVLVFPRQTLTPCRLIELSSRFGELRPSLDTRYQLIGYPEISVVGKFHRITDQKALFTNGGIEWHFDYAQLPVPSLVSLLYGLVVPPTGGDTLFADTRSAYSALSESRRSLIDGLRAAFSYDTLNEILDDADSGRKAHESPQVAPSEHAIVQEHPVTSRKALLLAPEIMIPLGDTTMELIDSLLKHCTSEQFVYRHKWRPGDLVVFDNRSTIHTATTCDVDVHERVHYRTTVLPNLGSS